MGVTGAAGDGGAVVAAVACTVPEAAAVGEAAGGTGAMEGFITETGAAATGGALSSIGFAPSRYGFRLATGAGPGGA